MMDNKLTATQMMMRTDVRRRRATALAAAVLHKLQPQIDATHPEELPHRIARLVNDALFEAMFDSGVEILTDADRFDAGLPPRGPDGWTADEIAALERKRLEALYAPIAAPTWAYKPPA